MRIDPNSSEVANNAPQTARSTVLGLHMALHDIDVGSPGGVRWVGDAAGDPLAIDVRDAIRDLVADDRAMVSPPAGGRELETSLVGHGGKSASLIWHSQCVASLVELGFVPGADCLNPHLDAIADRLVDARIINPLDPNELDYDNNESIKAREPWVVRARHLAWVVACLSEYQPVGDDHGTTLTSPDRDPDDDWNPGQGSPAAPAREQRTRWTERRYRRLLRHAYDGLVGSHITGPKPAKWASPRRDEFELVWHEVILDRLTDGNEAGLHRPPARRPNALTTFYSVLAICRAERHHHTRYADAWHALAHDEQTASALVDHLLTQVEVEPAPGGPIVRLRSGRHGDGAAAPSEWNEPWVRDAFTLPPSAIALLALTLVEYARFLAPLVPPGVQPRVAGSLLKAHRLGQALLARPESDEVLWSRAVDAFFLYGEDEAWFTPAYSLCLRAVLETGAATPDHPLVRDALQTIDRLRTDDGKSDDGKSWVDATYHTGLNHRARDLVRHKRYTRRGADFSSERQPKSTQHVTMDVVHFADHWEPNEEIEWKPRAASIHAAALAYSSVRRARSRVDPRVAVDSAGAPKGRTATRSSDRAPAKRLSLCPFTRLELTDCGAGKFDARLTCDAEDALYTEHAQLDQRAVDLLKAVSGNDLTLGELLSSLPERSRPVSLQEREDRPLRSGESKLNAINALRSAIERLNVFFGCQIVVLRHDADAHQSRATLARGVVLQELMA
jgi:hypothetical protein